jgi:putative phage-type endonuclease
VSHRGLSLGSVGAIPPCGAPARAQAPRCFAKRDRHEKRTQNHISTMQVLDMSDNCGCCYWEHPPTLPSNDGAASTSPSPQQRETGASVTPPVTHFGDAAVWTGITDSNRAAWIDKRRSLMTASNVAAILGLDEFRNALDVYADILVPEAEPVRLSLDDPRLWGKALERSIAETAAQHYGWELSMSGALLQSRRYPFLGATLDAEIRPAAADQWLVYEGKTTSWMRRRDWDEDAGVPPDRVLCQAQTQLLVTGAPVCIVFCLIGGHLPCRINVGPNEEFQALIVECSQEFLERVRTLDPPPPDWRSKQALQRLYPGESGEAIELSREALEWTRELQQLAAQRLESKRREAELCNLIRATMRGASYGKLPEPVEGGKVLWKCVTEERAEHMVRASSSRVLRLVKTMPKGLVVRRLDPTPGQNHAPVRTPLDAAPVNQDQLIRIKSKGRSRR